ncbi:TPA: response regulator, partial [Candidatus Poribacteria bacterium]|nr:response regulator [Candidatus Poribacteria bacterium]HEX30388.1 response regulator [Candidatus Poribacteria bacterium]
MALNILVVDDSSVMRSIIIKTLHLCGLPLGEIYQAVNGLEGLQALEENWIDLALVDINMPVMDGEE